MAEIPDCPYRIEDVERYADALGRLIDVAALVSSLPKSVIVPYLARSTYYALMEAGDDLSEAWWRLWHPSRKLSDRAAFWITDRHHDEDAPLLRAGIGWSQFIVGTLYTKWGFVPAMIGDDFATHEYRSVSPAWLARYRDRVLFFPGHKDPPPPAPELPSPRALAPLLRKFAPLPEDLTLLREALALIRDALAAVRTRAVEPNAEEDNRKIFVPNEPQKRLLDALDGQALKGDTLAKKAKVDRSKMFTVHLKELREVGLVKHRDRLGYYRPNAPPPELGGIE